MNNTPEARIAEIKRLFAETNKVGPADVKWLFELLASKEVEIVTLRQERDALAEKERKRFAPDLTEAKLDVR